MTTIRSTDATIEVSRDGEHWISFPGGLLSAQGLSFFPGAQESAYHAARAEEERYRSERLGYEIGSGIVRGPLFELTVIRWNQGLFESISGAHTRKAMRYRKIARYIRNAQRQRSS